MEFIPTAKCIALPAHLNKRNTPKPLPDLSDEDIDCWLQIALGNGCSYRDLPTTQHGRRVAVKMLLSRK